MILANFLSALRALRVNKLRSGLTMLGILVGVGTVIAMVAVGAGARERVADQIRSVGSNLIVITAGSLNSRGVRGGGGSLVTVTEDDAMAIQREIDAVQAAAPTIGHRPMQLVHDNVNWATGVVGVTPEWHELRGIVDGRPITADDQRSAAKVVLVGQTVAHKLFGDENPLGATIRIGRAPFTVIGVLELRGQSTSGQDQDDLVVVPLAAARTKLIGRIPGKARAVWVITVKVREGEDLAEAEASIRELLRRRHRLQHDQDDDFRLRNYDDVVRTHEETSRVMAHLLAAVAAVSLLVGGIGIMNMMLVSVTERTREIGLRMAVGARRRDILVQFLTEAVTLSLIGGAMGVGVGIAGTEALGYVAEWRTVVAAEMIVLAFGFAAVTGIVFGFYPAYKAAGLDPIEALRWE